MKNFETDNANYYYKDYEKEELQSIYDARKSFYKKAFVIKYNKNIYLLQSYNTIVAHVINGKFESYGKYSQTTTRHQNELKKQFSY